MTNFDRFFSTFPGTNNKIHGTYFSATCFNINFFQFFGFFWRPCEMINLIDHRRINWKQFFEPELNNKYTNWKKNWFHQREQFVFFCLNHNWGGTTSCYVWYIFETQKKHFRNITTLKTYHFITFWFKQLRI